MNILYLSMIYVDFSLIKILDILLLEPASLFEKRLLSVSEIVTSLQASLFACKQLNPELKVCT